MAEKKSKHKTEPIDPLRVTENLGIQTFRRALRRPWSKDEDAMLTSLVQAELADLERTGFGTPPESVELVQWDLILAKIPGRKPKDCRKRWQNLLDPALKKGRWMPEEDRKLLDAHALYGPAWKRIAKEIEGRTDDQCAKRYIEVLDPTMTENRLREWSIDEDLRLIALVAEHGTRWRKVLQTMQSRPLLTCRNRWRKVITEVTRGKAHPRVAEAVRALESQLPAPVALLARSLLRAAIASPDVPQMIDHVRLETEKALVSMRTDQLHSPVNLSDAPDLGEAVELGRGRWKSMAFAPPYSDQLLPTSPRSMPNTRPSLSELPGLRVLPGIRAPPARRPSTAGILKRTLLVQTPMAHARRKLVLLALLATLSRYSRSPKTRLSANLVNTTPYERAERAQRLAVAQRKVGYDDAVDGLDLWESLRSGKGIAMRDVVYSPQWSSLSTAQPEFRHSMPVLEHHVLHAPETQEEIAVAGHYGVFFHGGSGQGLGDGIQEGIGYGYENEFDGELEEQSHFGLLPLNPS